MRAFTVFASALVLANISEAVPMNMDFAQIDADVEAEFPLQKDQA